MKLRRQSSFSVSFMLAASMLILSMGIATAQEGESEASQRKTKQTAAMSEKVYKKLSEAQALADEDQFAAAKAKLDEVKNMSKLTPYETAQLYNFYGFVYYSQDNMREAISAYETVLAQPELPEGLRNQTIYTLAQLHFTTEDYGKAIELINQWLATQTNPAPEPFILLASARYQLEQYPQMIEPIERAMDIARSRDQPIKEQWWLLLRVAHFEMDNYPEVRDILEILVTNWPKKEYWTQLSAMYGELEQEKRQLAAYRSAYDQGLLVRSSELVQLAQLLLQAEAPFEASKVLDVGLNDDVVERVARNYRLLAQALQLAQEDRDAIPALQQAARLSDDGELDVRLAQSHLNLSQYDDCIDSAREGLNKGGLKRQDQAFVILGMCLVESKNYNEAKTAFSNAAKDKRSSKIASQWIRFIENEQERRRKLDESLKAVRTASN